MITRAFFEFQDLEASNDCVPPDLPLITCLAMDCVFCAMSRLKALEDGFTLVNLLAMSDAAPQNAIRENN